MEVLKSGDAPSLISNLEVMQLLQERIAERQAKQPGSAKGGTGGEKKIRKGPCQNRDWIEQTVLDHLESSPAGGPGAKVEEMPKLVERLRRDPGGASTSTKNGGKYPPGYGLTDAETLQVLNHLPTSLVELHLLIEDIDQREALDDEEKQMGLLRLISEYSGRPVEEGGGDDMDTDE